MSGSALPQAAAATSDHSEMDVSTAVAVMTVLGNKLRIEIWCKLMPHCTTGLTAGAIANQLAMAPSSVSFRLQQMAKVGALKPQPNGRYTIYSVRTELVCELCKFLTGTIS
jgi:ArsR family transcriptional regulator, arsenate/arsenite/antimonite-responsive transcriptional repressor